MLQKINFTPNGATDAQKQTIAKFVANLMFPVGSLYCSTATVCPLQTLGVGTWKKVANNLTIATSANVAIKGNNGNINVFSQTKPQTTTLNSEYNFGNGNRSIIAAGGIGNNMGVDSSLRFSTVNGEAGLTGTTSLSNLTVNIFQRTA